MKEIVCIQEFLAGLSQETEVLLVPSIVLFAGFVMTRLTNTLNLPRVSGYILAGILIRPYGLDLTPMKIINSMEFVSDSALAFITLGVGKFSKRDVMKKTGGKIITITVFGALAVGVPVTLFMRLVFHMGRDFALILGAVATAMVLADTMTTINQYKAKGEFANTLLQIATLDGIVCLSAFNIMAAVANSRTAGSLAILGVVMPIVFNLLALLLGLSCGCFLNRLLMPTRGKDNRLILVVAILLRVSGVCTAVNISPLLSCMAFGAFYTNLTSDKKLYRQINNFSPSVISVFSIVSGMNPDVRALATADVMGVSYFIVRIVGKYLGTCISYALTGISKEIRNYTGLALIPQVGVVVGLALLGQRSLPSEIGELMLTTILSSSVLCEMVGPMSTRVALLLSGGISGRDILDKMVMTGQEKQEEQGGWERQEEQERNSGQGEKQEEIETEESDSDSGEEEGEKLACRETDMDGDVNEKNSVGDEADNEKDSSGDEAGSQGDSAGDEVGSKKGNGHELANYIREMFQGVNEQNELDIEQDLLSEKQERCEKGGGGKKQGKKKWRNWKEEAIVAAAPFSASESRNYTLPLAITSLSIMDKSSNGEES